jgi:hypothetical protein
LIPDADATLMMLPAPAGRIARMACLVPRNTPSRLTCNTRRHSGRVAQEKKLLRGKTVAVDATTLEANAAMKSIVRKDTGEDYRKRSRPGEQ